MWWHYAIGYGVSVGVGYAAIRLLMRALWISLGESIMRDVHVHPEHPMMVGVLERTLYTAAWQFGKPEFVGLWLAVKVAGQWKGWSEDVRVNGQRVPGRAFFNLFLIGNGFSVAYGMVGGLLIDWLNKGLLVPAIAVPSILTVTVLLFRFWAGKQGESDSEVRRKDLRSVFNADAPNPMDAHIARLSVLFEDLRIEVIELSQVHSPDADPVRHSVNYFLRRSIATLHEFSDALAELDRDPQFTAVKDRFDAQAQGLWTAALDHFAEYAGKKGQKRILTAVRDDIGGHFGYEAAMKGLKALLPGPGELEIFVSGKTGKGGCKLHFARHISVAALSHYAGPKSFEAWFPAFHDEVLAAYQHGVRAVEIIVKFVLWDRFQ